MTEDELRRKAMVEQGHTVVANRKKDKALIEWASQNALYTYIGRPRRGRPLTWGNPFEIGKHGWRDVCCDLYRDHLSERHDLLSRLGELRGKVLGCWCYPERCHGNELINCWKRETA